MDEFIAGAFIGMLAGMLIYHLAGFIATKLQEKKENKKLFKDKEDEN